MYISLHNEQKQSIFSPVHRQIWKREFQIRWAALPQPNVNICSIIIPTAYVYAQWPELLLGKSYSSLLHTLVHYTHHDQTSEKSDPIVWNLNRAHPLACNRSFLWSKLVRGDNKTRLSKKRCRSDTIQFLHPIQFPYISWESSLKSNTTSIPLPDTELIMFIQFFMPMFTYSLITIKINNIRFQNQTIPAKNITYM